MTIQDQLELIKRGASEIINEEDLVRRLEECARKKRPLRVKAGFDPTAPDIHLGHTVLLRKLRQFQDLGHKVIFLVGDATGLVGDPSGQSKTRRTLTWKEVDRNARTYVKQVSKVLKTGSGKVFERRHNSEWFSKLGPGNRGKAPFAFEEFVDLAQHYTVARLLERDDFQKRLKENKPISYLELFYPLMQGYDSVKLKADVELGGTDQKFNLLVGRELQRAYGQEPQIVITMPLLEGTDGVAKMSKSLDNAIGIDEAPETIFAKTMSVSDEMMRRYYELLTDEDMAQVTAAHPKEAKMRLAGLLVEAYHGAAAARTARRRFEKVFSQGGVPDEVGTAQVTCGPETPTASAVMIQMVKEGTFTLHTGNNSTSEVLRQFKQGAVKVDGQKAAADTPLEAGREYLFQVAKRSFKKVKIIKKKT
jgi:tyrosyl-tRNA synthetase